jgi:hypothetical protein
MIFGLVDDQMLKKEKGGYHALQEDKNRGV